MDTKQELIFQELASAQAERLVRDDAYYEALATPLRSAKILKAEEKALLANFLQFKEIRHQLEAAEKLIREHLASLISKEEFETVLSELNQAPAKFLAAIENYAKKVAEHQPVADGEEPLFLQNLCGFSDQTLLHCYQLVQELVAKKEYEDAIAVLMFLEIMAPYVSSYWFAHGLCLQALNRHKDAIETFTTSQLIQPENPNVAYALIKSCKELKEHDKMQHALHHLKELMAHMDKQQQSAWQEKIYKL